jgi:SAM-dependent methyltransferase
MEHKDLFSGHAKLYAAFRPSYPNELYEFIFKHLSDHKTAWDCGTGNGQVANYLADHFRSVFATDISAKQLDEAIPRSNIVYSLSPAEETAFMDHAFDLITVGQALHWMNLEKFYSEVTRVAKPGGLLAVWGYAILTINPELDEHLHHFYKKIVGPYWDKAREIKSPRFFITVSWDLNHLAGYLETWSATQKYIAENKTNPIPSLIDKLRPYWKDSAEIKTVAFPLFLRLGRV